MPKRLWESGWLISSLADVELANFPSPLERQFAISLLNVSAQLGHTPHVLFDGSDWSEHLLPGDIPNDGDLFVFPQRQIGPYRVDFHIILTANGEIAAEVIVETDGYAFHRATKDQVISDNRRDRALMRNHHAVIRFSGSEIHQDVEGCAIETIEFLEAHAAFHNG